MRKSLNVATAKMEAGFKNEEDARMLVQNEMAVMKEEIENINMGQ